MMRRTINKLQTLQLQHTCVASWLCWLCVAAHMPSAQAHEHMLPTAQQTPARMSRHKALADKTFRVTTTVTPSICQSNGEILVHIENGEGYYNYQFALDPVKEGGFSIPPAPGAHLQHIPAGEYRLTVSAIPKLGTKTEKLKTIIVNVPGDYRVVDFSLNQELSRNSYAHCGTGRIVLKVEGGKAPYSFSIDQAPDGIAAGHEVEVSEIAPNTFALRGEDYPAGEYKITVADHCSAISHTVKVDKVMDLPTFREENFKILRAWSLVPEVNAQYGCSSPIVQLQLSQKSLDNNDLMGALRDGRFEIALARKGTAPQLLHWQTLKSGVTDYAMDISPAKVSDVYSNHNDTHDFFIRLKGCPDLPPRSFSLSVHEPKFVESNATSTSCNEKLFNYFAKLDHEGLLCYPLHLRLKDVKTGSYREETFTLADRNASCKIPIVNNREFRLEVRDDNQKLVHTQRIFERAQFFEFQTQLHCDNYDTHVRFASLANCRPYVVFVHDDHHQLVQRTVVTDDDDVRLEKLHYGRDYYVSALDNDDGITLGASHVSHSQHPFTLLGVHPVEYRKDFAQFSGQHPMQHHGAIIDISDGGKFHLHHEQKNYVPDSNKDFITPTLHMPPAHYVARSSNDCGAITASLDWPGGYNTEAFNYIATPSCGGLVVRPQGYVTLGRKRSDKTYFSIISGPSDGYQKKVYREGEDIILTANGDYQLVIQAEANYTMRGLDTLSIHYEQHPLKLAEAYKIAYSCVESSVGHIWVKAEDGFAPYAYELWDADNKVKLRDQPDEFKEGVAHFLYGYPGVTYTVRFRDACNSPDRPNFSEQVTIGDLTSTNIAHTTTQELCTGETIVLFCLPIGDCQWYDPSGKPISKAHTVRIDNATTSMSGTYKVKITSADCGSGKEGFVDIKVHPCYAPVNPHLMDCSKRQR